MNVRSFVLAAAALGTLAALAFAHPHFPKTVEMKLGMTDDAPSIKVSHLTVTFDQALFDKTKDGDVWHMAGASLDTTADVKIGGHAVAKGHYRLLTRKAKNGEWELVLDAGGKAFSRDLSDQAFALATTFEKGQPVQEHLRLDLQPSGDKHATVLNLEAHFGEFKATSKIEVAEAAAGEKKKG